MILSQLSEKTICNSIFSSYVEIYTVMYIVMCVIYGHIKIIKYPDFSYNFIFVI